MEYRDLRKVGRDGRKEIRRQVVQPQANSKQKVSLLLDNLKVIWYKKVDTSNSRKRSKITGVRKVHKMVREQRKYEKGYKVQAVKLAKEIGAGGTAGQARAPGVLASP